jgi:tripartite-type tricarboxylate transporter receptor subunit TctC
MAEDGLSELGQWVRRLKEDPDIVLKFGGAAMKGDLWSSADLLKIYDPEQRKRVTAGTVTKELKRAGFVQVYGGKQLRMPKSGQMRLFAVRNAEKWAAVTDGPTLAKHYDDTRGPIDRIKPKY